MFKLKGKTIWLFAIIAVGLASLGFYFYTSLTSLNQKVEDSIYPQKRSNYLRDITLNVNKLNNLYLVDSIKFSSKKVDTIIRDIEKNLDSIKVEFKGSTALSAEKIDTIPKLLRKIQEEYLELEKVKKKSQSRFINDLESLLKEELAELNLNKRDSVTIVRQITSEIYDRSIDSNSYFKEVDVEEEKEKSRGFFQRLFGGSSDDEEQEANEAQKRLNDSLINSIRQTSKDTLVSTKVDTLLTQSAQIGEPPAEMKIISIFERIQRRRIDILENLKEEENRIFQKNYEVNNFIENILNEILFEEVNSFNNSIYEFTEKSKDYLWKSGLLILIFLILAIISTYVVIKDINKSIYYQKKLERSEKRALLEAEEKQKFLSTMSHELRTPLTSIIGFTDMLNQDEEYVKAIKTASNYLYQMTNEILDMAKIKAGIIEIKNEAFAFNEVFEMIESNFKPLIENQNLEAVFNHPKAPVYVIADQYRIQQIVYNLVHNALKYTENGYIKVRYTATPKDNEEVLISIIIEDSGIGMTPEEQKTIFKDYQQAGTHKNKMKGTGLGMGIVKNLVSKLGGKLSLKSEVNQGTRFTINFRFKQASKEEIKKEEVNEIEFPKDALKHHKIFVVDDDLLITKLYQGIFKQFGAIIEVSNFPKQAFAHLKENQDYDMVIFDMKMPEMNGSELLKKLEQHNARPKNTVICTANVLLSEKDQDDFKKFDYQLFKPLKKKDIIKLITQVFDVNSNSTSGQKEEISAIEKSTDFSYSLEDLKAYTGNDEEALIEMLNFLLDENTKELELLKNAIEDKNLEETANRIHKLSSRFAQLQIKAPYDPKQTELDLRDSKAETLNQATKIYAFWKYCNSSLLSKYGED